MFRSGFLCNYCLMHWILSLLFLLAAPQVMAAETRYVTDSVSFSLREAPNKGAKFLNGIDSSTQVEVLETQAETGYSRVKTPEGQVGYIESRRLQKQPTAKLLLEEANRKLAQYQSGKPQEAVSDDYEMLRYEYTRLEAERNRLQKELDAIQRTSANAMQIAMERNDLRKELADISREKAQLEQQYRESNNGSEQRWFIIGAGVLFAGALLGFLLPYVRISRQKSYPTL